MVSIFLLIFSSSNILGTVPLTTSTVGITVPFMFLSIFSSQARSKNLSIFSIPFIFTPEQQNPLNGKLSFLFLLLINIRSGLLAEISWSVCISKSLRILCISFFRTNPVLCTYHLVVWSTFNLLHNSQRIIFSTRHCLILYFFSVS